MLQSLIRSAAVVIASLVASSAYADVALLLAQPYGRPGSFNPTGHVGVYLSRVCADTPTVVRRCTDGESGVVVSRYNHVGDLDWAAIPLIPYLYAVDRAVDVPAFASPETVLDLRDTYRRRHLRDIAPDPPSGMPPKGHWTQLVGAVYDRQIIAFSVTTTLDQDDALIADLNSRDNRRRFHLLFRNCADFASEVINRYHPRAIRSNVIADLGFTTPKQITKSLVKYGGRTPEAELQAYLIPQIPGSRADSGRARGVLEGLLKTKKYSVPLAIVQPWVPVGLATGYMVTGRFNPHRLATRAFGPLELEQHAMRAVE